MDRSVDAARSLRLGSDNVSSKNKTITVDIKELLSYFGISVYFRIATPNTGQ